MNYRDYKLFHENGVYHVFNRGVAKQDIFFDDQDYSLFLRRFKEQVLSRPMPLSKRNSYRRKVFPAGLFKIYAYCLMPNHFHFLIRQTDDVPVSELFLRIMTGYSKVFNIKYERVGSLFQDQFKAVRVENDEQLLWLTAYIHKNPKVAGLVSSLENWPWSSYLDYVGTREGILADKSFVLSLPQIGQNADGYRKFVGSAFDNIKSRKDIEILLID